MIRTLPLAALVVLTSSILLSPAYAEKAENGNNGWEGLYTRYDDNKNVAPDKQEGYQAIQLLDGWAAMGVAVGEPLYFRPAVWIKRCAEGNSTRTAIALSPACASLGVVEGVFYSLFDLSTGLADILTGGYFRISKKAGVFEYFE